MRFLGMFLKHYGTKFMASSDEKPGMQAIGNTAPDLPPRPGTHEAFARDHEYKRHGTLCPLAGIDLLTGRVHACIEDRHCSREFVAFLRQLNAAYPPQTAIKLILDKTDRVERSGCQRDAHAKSFKYSDPGRTAVTSSRSRARVPAT
jgi:hypothetical protein